jgi:uncharacterized protein (DUF2236 family)
MKPRPVTLVQRAGGATPHQAIAAAVIRQAIVDLTHQSHSVRESAVRFFADSPSLLAWCAVASLDPDVVSGYVRRSFTDRARRSVA